MLEQEGADLTQDQLNILSRYLDGVKSNSDRTHRAANSNTPRSSATHHDDLIHRLQAKTEPISHSMPSLSMTNDSSSVASATYGEDEGVRLEVSDWLANAEEEISTCSTALEVLLNMCKDLEPGKGRPRALVENYHKRLDALQVLSPLQEPPRINEFLRAAPVNDELVTATKNVCRMLGIQKAALKHLLRLVQDETAGVDAIHQYCSYLQMSVMAKEPPLSQSLLAANRSDHLQSHSSSGSVHSMANGSGSHSFEPQAASNSSPARSSSVDTENHKVEPPRPTPKIESTGNRINESKPKVHGGEIRPHRQISPSLPFPMLFPLCTTTAFLLFHHTHTLPMQCYISIFLLLPSLRALPPLSCSPLLST